MFINTKLKILYPLLVFSITFMFYIFFAGRLKYEFPTHAANYLSQLAYTFLHGRLDLIHPLWTGDLSFYNGKYYPYWGPTPILLILPFVVLFGINISDALYTSIISSFTPVIFYFILNELERLSIISISQFKKLIFSLFLGFGTVYFVLAVNGGVWFTSQAISTLYIFIALLFILKFKRLNKLLFLLLATFFLDLGIWGRISFIFYLFFFLGIIIYADKIKASLAYFLLLNVLLFLLFTSYNYLRFGHILETGFSLPNLASVFIENKQKYGVLNLNFLPQNFYYMFLNFPKVKLVFPYLQFDYWGNSIFSTSPLFLLLIAGFQKRYWIKSLLFFNGSLLLSAICTISFLLLYFNTGFLQFGNRYLMDAIPIMLILLAQFTANVPFKLILFLSFLSIVINTIGVIWFLNIPLV